MTYIKAQKISLFRKVALSLWGSGGDPSVYGFLELDVTEKKLTSSPLPIIIKALAEIMKTHKELNSILRFGRLYYRKNINISVMVNIPEKGKHDLSLSTLENVDQMNLQDISKALYRDTDLIRQRKDPRLGFVLKLIHKLPWFITKFFLNLYSFLTHDLAVNLNWLKLPNAPFGSVIVTNIGSLGIKKALVPLVPLSRSAVLISVGEITKEARVINDKIEIREIIHLGVTFDHRFFDGSHAASMIHDFEKHFQEIE